MELVITPQGQIRAIFAEYVPLLELGRLSITRASHVEPTSEGAWCADLSPVGGPSLGPFGRRSEALAAEALWLGRHWLVPRDPNQEE